MRELGHSASRAACSWPKWHGAQWFPRRQTPHTEVLLLVWWQHETFLYSKKVSSLLTAQRLLWNNPWCAGKHSHWNQQPSVWALNKTRGASPARVLGRWGLFCRQNLRHELNTALPYEWVIIGHVKQSSRVTVGFIMRDWFHNTNYVSPGDEGKTQGFCL